MKKGILLFLLIVPLLATTSYALTNVTACGTLSSSDTYVLTQNLDSNLSTCLTLNNNNIVLDCNDYNITFGGTDNWGIVSPTGNDNLTVQNCNVYQNATDNSRVYAIQLDTATNLTVQDSYVELVGNTSVSVALYSYQGDDVYFLNNEIVTNGDNSNCIRTGENDGVTISGNTITVNSGSESDCLYLEDGDNYNISYNTINSDGYFASDGATIRLLGIDNVLVHNNAVTNTGDYNTILKFYYGDTVTVAENLTVYDNDFTSYSLFGVCVWTEYASNVVIDNNTCFTNNSWSMNIWGTNDTYIINNDITSANSRGVYAFWDGFNNQKPKNLTVINNIVNANGSHGLYYQYVDEVLTYNNTVSTTGDTSRGVYHLESSNSNASYNIISTTGSDSHPLYVIQFNTDDYRVNRDIWLGYNDLTFSTGSNGISFKEFGQYSGMYQNEIITGNTFTDNNASDDYGDVYVQGYWNNTLLTDQIIEGYDFDGALLSFEDSTYGLVNYTEPITATGSNLSSNLTFGNNSVISDFDYSANVTLYGIGDRGFVIPVIMKDGEQCYDCVNYTSLTATNVLFSVTGFSEYEIGDNYTTIEMTIYSPTNTTYQGSGATASVNIQISVNDTLDTAWYEYDSNGTNVSYTPNSSVIVDVGQHNIILWVNNSYGSEDTITIYFTYEQVVAAPTGAFGFNVTEATEGVRDVIIVIVPLIVLFIIIGIYKGWFKQIGGAFRR